MYFSSLLFKATSHESKREREVSDCENVSVTKDNNITKFDSFGNVRYKTTKSAQLRKSETIKGEGGVWDGWTTKFN